MANVVLSRNGVGALVAALAALVLAAGGCATSKDAQVRKIQARNAYDQGGSNLREGRVSLGLAALQEAVQLDPENAVYHLDQAVASYRKALTFPTYPSPELAYHNMGEAYLRQGKLREAEESLRQAIQLETKNQFSHYLLGVVLAETGRKSEAANVFRQARDLDPDSSVGLLTVEALKSLETR